MILRAKEQSFRTSVEGAKQEGESVSSVTLLRHGAHADVGVRLTGRAADSGLTEQGRDQARTAAERLRLHPPSAIFASPRRRTRETAQIVGDLLGLPVSVSEALDELDFGEWTGLTFGELDDDPRWHQWNAHRGTASAPGGETQRQAQARALAFAFEAAATHARPLLVTHCDIIRALVCWSERRPLDRIHEIACEPGSLTHLDLVLQEQAA
jgi:broad specificity phosphatase PhoE